LGLAALAICFLIFVIGIVKEISVMQMFMTSIGLAVAAIPEGLPAIVTILLSIGVTAMAKKNAIIRKLPAVETLGSSTVIASDKTGTLTQNKMEVVATYVGETAAEALAPLVKGGMSRSDRGDSTSNRLLLQLASMCTDCILSRKDGQILVDGEPTEKAIVNAALKLGENKDDLYEEMNRINDIPFDSSRKLMSTIHRYGNKYRIITKGAPDVLIKKCILTESDKTKIKQSNEKMAGKALRVIAVGYADLDYLPSKIDENLEQNLIFVGLIGMIDPPRAGVKEAVNTCFRAGIKTVMITGDHIITAEAIARELGILKQGDIAISGEELDKISQDKLEKDIDKYSVFARVSPEHKVRIVKAFRSKRKYSCNDR